MPSFAGKRKKNKIVGSLRRSKTAFDAGCGALVEFPGFSGIMGGQNLWGNPEYFSEGMKIHERNLELLTGKDYFVQAVANPLSTDFFKNDHPIPIIRFPEYYYCPKCHELDYAFRLASNYHNDYQHTVPLKCNHCGAELIPSRFIVSCEDGHLDDFPYVWWVHRGRKEKCPNPKLKIFFEGTESGLGGIHIKCETCGAETTMIGCLGKDALNGLSCLGRSPWLGSAFKHECGKPVRALMRGATNLYYPRNLSALTIPPWSSSVQFEIDRKFSFYQEMIEMGEEGELLLKKKFMKDGLQEKLRCTANDFLDAIHDRFDNKVETLKIDDILYDEYRAFTGGEFDDIYFKTETASISSELKPYIQQIKLIKRLRQVTVLEGFCRIVSPDSSSVTCPISSKKENWLPAVEMLGEGIFIQLPTEAVQKWRTANISRYSEMAKAYLEKKNKNLDCGFVVLHTFSHMLIREMAAYSGYDMSSIREKLYFDMSDPNHEMCGLLIYTASSSSDGSLGGLVRLGREENFNKLIQKMLQKALWCSNDPICMDAKEVRPDDLLNYAACYACAFLPETSCCNNNILLDRAALIGTYKDPSLGYFSDLLE